MILYHLGKGQGIKTRSRNRSDSNGLYHLGKGQGIKTLIAASIAAASLYHLGKGLKTVVSGAIASSGVLFRSSAVIRIFLTPLSDRPLSLMERYLSIMKSVLQYTLSMIPRRHDRWFSYFCPWDMEGIPAYGYWMMHFLSLVARCPVTIFVGSISRRPTTISPVIMSAREVI